MRARGRWVSGAAALVALVVIGSALAATAGNRAAQAKKPIVIGWAFDSSGNMAPFDNPALAAAKLRIAQINGKGGVLGRKIVLKTCDTQGNKADVATSCALRLLGDRANVIFTTCDVDLAAPVVTKAINAGVLAVASCIGTDQMGPKRFGAKGRLAFSFGNVAQDEGSAMAQYAWSKGWRRAALATDTVIVYFKDVVKAFEARWKQLGGKVVAKETYQSGGGTNVQNAVTRLNGVKADVIVTSTAGAFGALSTFVSGLRSLGNNTPILAIKRAHGSTKGIVLSRIMERFKNVPTISGNVSFSAKLHTVFGRRYRVIKIQNNVPKVVGTIVAKVVVKI